MFGVLRSLQETIPIKEREFISVKENVELMRRWFKEVWNEGRTQTISDLLAPNGIGIGQLEDGSPLRGPAEFVSFVERIRGAFPDINVVVEDAFGAKDKLKTATWIAAPERRGGCKGNVVPQGAPAAQCRSASRTPCNSNGMVVVLTTSKFHLRPVWS
jgi:hypothetical protein